MSANTALCLRHTTREGTLLVGADDRDDVARLLKSLDPAWRWASQVPTDDDAKQFGAWSLRGSSGQAFNHDLSGSLAIELAVLDCTLVLDLETEPTEQPETVPLPEDLAGLTAAELRSVREQLVTQLEGNSIERDGQRIVLSLPAEGRTREHLQLKLAALDHALPDHAGEASAR